MTPNFHSLTHTHTHTPCHPTYRFQEAHINTHGHRNENQAVCHLRFAYLEERAYTTQSSMPHCFELWHILAVPLTYLISQLDSGRDALVY